MRWLLFSYEQDTLVKQCNDLLQVVGQTVIHEYHHGKSSVQEIKEKINQHKPDRIIVIANEENLGTNRFLFKTLTDHLLIPVYVCQATMNAFSPIPVLLLTCTTENKTADLLSPTDIIQNATNQLINVYPHILRYVESSF
jgi:hypothetical protein